MKFKSLYKFLFVVVFILFTNKSYSEENSAFLDLNYLMTKSTAGLSINKQLEDLKKKNIAKLNKMEKAINEKDKKLISQKNILSKEDFEKKVINLRKEASEYQNLRQQYIKESNNKFIQAQAQFIKKLTPILGEYSEKNNLSMIFQKKNIIIGKSELDITKDILEITNKKIKTIKIN
ncbi:OmpH family outer membrane protein [Candidatus Pelagibacter sp.]|nr:OmpH family outer membrane protein [Candidatus Pelagibacter sp.]